MMMANRSIVLLLTFVFFSCQTNHNEDFDPFLEEVLNELNQIKSSRYISHLEVWAPGDTIPSQEGDRRVIAFDNPSDTTLGASWVGFYEEDTTKFQTIYDGHMSIKAYHEEKTLIVDSFKVRKLPFRPLTPPFYTYTTDLLTYIGQTKDSLMITKKDLGNTLYYKFTIYADRNVEFFGKAYYLEPSPYSIDDPTSRYELWIDKASKLPFKKRREMAHNISVESVFNPKFNRDKLEDFEPLAYFPAGYEILQYGTSSKNRKPNQLIGKTAPNWKLLNAEGAETALEDIDSKVVLIQFTSVNCGPCKASIPFLKQLQEKYDPEDFHLVAIESYNRNSNVLERYKVQNQFTYPFLMSEKAINQAYQVRATPVFFLLDAKRHVRKVFNGYSPNSSDQEIIAAISELI